MGLYILTNLVELKSFFSKYESTKGERGKLTVAKNGVIWDSKHINWKNITDMNISTNEIDNQHKWDYSHKNNVSDGLNLIEIKTNRGENFKGHYKLTSKDQLIILEDLLLESILTNGLNYEVARKIVKPNSYQEHQLLKKQIKDNLESMKA